MTVKSHPSRVDERAGLQSVRKAELLFPGKPRLAYRKKLWEGPRSVDPLWESSKLGEKERVKIATDSPLPTG